MAERQNQAGNSRSLLLKELESGSTFDIVVTGGGATGLGIALEASLRGYRTLLLEQADFAKGTSSRSTKLVHGGVRYLAQGNIRLVREASVERGRLLRNAPHLVKNLSFIIPVYKKWDRFFYIIGLKLYDWIAGSLSLGSSVLISRKETISKLPNINSNKLIGGVLYHDGQFDDARLAINLAQSIFDHGGLALNYMKVNGLLKEANGKLTGVSAEDVETGKRFAIPARAVVNATGIFADDLLKLDDAAAPKSICVSQGIHLVLDKKFLPATNALMIPETSDGRVLFAVPWHDKIVVGTTDTPVALATLEPVALEKEIDFILQTAAQYFVEQPTRKDVLSVFAGLRPLAAPQEGKQKTKEISRSHKIKVSASQLFTIIGGKWTTYRQMGEDMINRIEKEMRWPHTKSVTATQHIHGYRTDVNDSDPFSWYGSDAPSVRSLMKGEEEVWISERLQIHKAQVLWAVQQEWARTLEDILSRRTRALLLDAQESIRMARPVATIMASLLNKDDTWIQQQVNDYTALAGNYLLKS